MKWTSLTDLSQINQIKESSDQQPIIIFKHSIRCSISAAALNRLERAWNESEMTGIAPYYLDLIAYRPVSNTVAESFRIPHASPQLLVIYQGDCIYHTSHLAISYAELKKQVERLRN